MATLSLPNRIEVGSGSINQLSKAILSCGATKPLIIMDAFLATDPLNIHKKVQDVLQNNGLKLTLFTDYSGEPTIEHVQDALSTLKDSQADCVVAVGGGSAIDISKSVSLFGLNSDLEWSEITSKPFLNRLPLIAVPTTAGTGSEATGIMVVSDPELGVKLNPGHSDLIPNIAILDPELTVSLPKHFTAFTGLDALTHAIEAYVSNRASMLTDSYALRAIKMIGEALPKVYEDGSNLEERQKMLLASCYAGTAFFNSSTNLVHAAGRALGNRFHIPHGLSVAALLPSVMRFGLKSAVDRYRDIAVALGEEPSKDNDELAQSSVEIIENYNNRFGIWDALQKYIQDTGKLSDSIHVLVEDALSGNGINTNRKLPSMQDIEYIYKSLFSKITVTNTVEPTTN
ncbi:iron-containing alcohol dehydrogenase [Virgibacillus dakarensis]|uniref:1,3-propanediol dehydrogenase n=1 Tax=Lentibacillus populi TaxID=1827502 RepID=A0A9W5TZ70_9BACI|nr:iron-containing alcohol dehydrogenase [Lentibacillus populi]MBT2217536.1 iron-containing alcohol dehydrogenase [Virgibacillus dakarensis]MTW87898.1 iron-containing alcohol dehydrogenase [Virgibacillus dakarensis]GGB45924.1 1,3-propanediol dehydrogenase [Lentibacillus populi]